MRLRRDGANRLAARGPRRLGVILWAQLRSLLVGLLALAAGIGFVFGDRVEATAILAVIVLSTAIGFVSELRAVRSMEALRRLGLSSCRVRRDGRLMELPAEALRRPPRPPGEPILTAAQWRQVVGYGLAITVATLLAFAIALGPLGATPRQAMVVAFLTLALAQPWQVLNMRPAGSRPLRNAVTRNPHVWVALALCLGLLGLAVYLPPLAALLQLAPPGVQQWSLIIVASGLPVAGRLVGKR